MSDQTMPYAVGSWVWCKVSNRVWWPGKVVDQSTVPDDFKEYMLKKRNPVAIVHFERENSYECVTSMDNVCLYSCHQKLGFLKKGYLLYEKQLRSGRITDTFSMSNFIEDVLSVEKVLGGDVNIFNQFKQEKENSNSMRKLIKELFVTTKEQKKRNRKLLLASKAKTPVSRAKFTSKTQPSVSHTPPKPSVVSYKFYCSNNCTFSTNCFGAYKEHVDMGIHEAPASINYDDIIAVTPM